MEGGGGGWVGNSFWKFGRTTLSWVWQQWFNIWAGNFCFGSGNSDSKLEMGNSVVGLATVIKNLDEKLCIASGKRDLKSAVFRKMRRTDSFEELIPVQNHRFIFLWFSKIYSLKNKLIRKIFDYFYPCNCEYFWRNLIGQAGSHGSSQKASIYRMLQKPGNRDKTYDIAQF